MSPYIPLSQLVQRPSIADSQAAQALLRLLEGRFCEADLQALLETQDKAAEQALFAAADYVRRQQMGDSVHLRALIEFSNYCRNACLYCGLRAPNQKLTRYRMNPEEIVQAAQSAAQLGFKTIVLQSGEDIAFTRERLAEIIREIKKLGVAVSLCVGERPFEDYAAWKEAGADRYLLRIETSDPELYALLHPGMSFENRIRCLQDLKALDYQLGSGVIVGLPGQSSASLARDLLFFHKWQFDMIGLGPFIPHPDTPLGSVPGGSLSLTLRMLALARLLLPQAHIVATTALGTIHPKGRELGLQVGANVMMPNCTPQPYRSQYELYPGKICLTEEAEHCCECLTVRLQSIGRHVDTGFGHARRLEQ